MSKTIFFILGEPVSVAELLGFITGLWTVYLVVRQRIWNFPIGIANNIFFLILFLDAALYADAWLQVVYMVLAFVGWWAWLKAGPEHSKLEVTDASWLDWLIALLIVVIGTIILIPILRAAHGFAPLWDALTTSLSLAATWLLNFKKIQNWFFWILADLIYIPLYCAKHLYLTAIVYICFLCLCFFGLYQWRESRRPVFVEVQRV